MSRGRVESPSTSCWNCARLDASEGTVVIGMICDGRTLADDTIEQIILP